MTERYHDRVRGGAKQRPDVAEPALIGVAPDRHRHGLGRSLVVRIVRALEARGVLLLSTGTLAAAVKYAPYEGARAFFEAVGFLHFDTIDPYPGRDAGNPCALLVMPIGRDRPAQTMSYPTRTLLLLPVLSLASAAALLAQPVTPGVRNDPPPAARDSAPPPKPAPAPVPVKQEPPKAAQVDPKKSARDGRKLAEQVVAAVGGLDAWNDKSWDLAFDFVMYKGKAETGRYSHIWYRSLDRYIVSGKNRDGKLWRVRFTSLSRHEGSGTIDGRDVADSSRARMLESAYGRYINDTYWFLMPFKLLDSGVYHRREADTTIGGKRYLVLTLSFAKVGLTPGDQYRLFINPRTKLVERWHYKLQSNREGEFIWSGYKRFGRLLLPTRRKAVDGGLEIRFENIRVDDDEKEKNRRRID